MPPKSLSPCFGSSWILCVWARSFSGSPLSFTGTTGVVSCWKILESPSSRLTSNFHKVYHGLCLQMLRYRTTVVSNKQDNTHQCLPTAPLEGCSGTRGMEEQCGCLRRAREDQVWIKPIAWVFSQVRGPRDGDTCCLCLRNGVSLSIFKQ